MRLRRQRIGGPGIDTGERRKADRGRERMESGHRFLPENRWFASTPDSPDTTADRAMGRPKRNPNAGGFKVDFANMGIEEARAKYERDNRTIYINLEHPQIFAARQRGGLEEPSFRRLSFEVAFSEYAIALASEMAGAGHYLDPVDPITDIRSTINRLAVAGAKRRATGRRCYRYIQFTPA
jgi:hypothetical protein